MKKNILIFILGLALCACGEAPPPAKGQASGSSFRTTAPSLLYFKNIRSSHYQQTEQPGTRIELYRLRKFARPGQGLSLVPVIANNWLKDEAYLFLEPAEGGQAFATPITIRWASDRDTGLYRLQPLTMENQHQLALQLYESIQAGRQLQALAADSTWAPIYAESGERSSFSITVRDYLKLTEAL